VDDELEHKCDGCGVVFDRDRNAALVMLQRERSGDVKIKASTRRPEKSKRRAAFERGKARKATASEAEAAE